MQIHLTLVSCRVGRSCFDSGARPGEGGDKLDWLVLFWIKEINTPTPFILIEIYMNFSNEITLIRGFLSRP